MVASGSPLPGVKVIMIWSLMFFVLENLKVLFFNIDYFFIFCLFFFFLLPATGTG